MSNTRLLTNYLLADEHVREINTTNSSMKGSLVKGRSSLPIYSLFYCGRVAAFATVIKSLWRSNGRVVDPSSLKERDTHFGGLEWVRGRADIILMDIFRSWEIAPHRKRCPQSLI